MNGWLGWVGWLEVAKVVDGWGLSAWYDSDTIRWVENNREASESNLLRISTINYFVFVLNRKISSQVSGPTTRSFCTLLW